MYLVAFMYFQQQVVEEQMNLVSPRGKTTNRSFRSPQNTTFISSPYDDQSKVPAAMRSSFAIGVCHSQKLKRDFSRFSWIPDFYT
jgi:hypothetical protein